MDDQGETPEKAPEPEPEPPQIIITFTADGEMA